MIKYYFAKFNSSKHTTITLCLLSHIRSDICVKMVKVGKEREVTLIQIPKSFSLASRRRPSSVVSILPWNVWYRRILHWGYNVLLFKKNKYPHLIKCFVIYTWKSRNDTLTGVHAEPTTHWPLRGPGADAVWEDQRDRCPLVTHAGILTFSTTSLHLQKANRKMRSCWIHACSAFTALRW